MPHVLTKPRRTALRHAHAGSSAAAHDRRFGSHPFTGPVLDTGSWSRFDVNQQRLLTFLDGQPRDCGVTTLSIHLACKVLSLRGVDIARLMDELHQAKAIFFASFELAYCRYGFFAVKPHSQHGDMPLSVARRLADQLISEGRA